MTAERTTYRSIAIIIGTGIWHAGFEKASWVLYVPFCLLLFAGITGICP